MDSMYSIYTDTKFSVALIVHCKKTVGEAEKNLEIKESLSYLDKPVTSTSGCSGAGQQN